MSIAQMPKIALAMQLLICTPGQEGEVYTAHFVIDSKIVIECTI